MYMSLARAFLATRKNIFGRRNRNEIVKIGNVDKCLSRLVGADLFPAATTSLKKRKSRAGNGLFRGPSRDFVPLPAFGPPSNMQLNGCTKANPPEAWKMDKIEKTIELKAPVSRVWRALTDHKEFGIWFKVNLQEPFVVGKTTRGNITYPGYEHLVMEVVTKKMEPERLFSFTWHPYAIDPKIDYSQETPTLVEFTLEKTAAGTLLKVVESGFENIPATRRDEAFRMNSGGWEEQLTNIEKYLADH
jgi:uncharacterized protein YndB with AHSA1/START domain